MAVERERDPPAGVLISSCRIGVAVGRRFDILAPLPAKEPASAKLP